MMNLKAEMTRFGVTAADIGAVTSDTERTIYNKLSGKGEFSVTEAIQIRDRFFPGLRLEYLFNPTT